MVQCPAGSSHQKMGRTRSATTLRCAGTCIGCQGNIHHQHQPEPMIQDQQFLKSSDWHQHPSHLNPLSSPLGRWFELYLKKSPFLTNFGSISEQSPALNTVLWAMLEEIFSELHCTHNTGNRLLSCHLIIVKLSWLKPGAFTD